MLALGDYPTMLKGGIDLSVVSVANLRGRNRAAADDAQAAIGNLFGCNVREVGTLRDVWGG